MLTGQLLQDAMFYILCLAVFYWLILSVLNQFNLDFNNRHHNLRTLSIIPTWKFFAPNPAHTDYELFIRDKYSNGDVSKFRIVSLRRNRTLSQIIYNPNARRGKVLSDSVRIFTRFHNVDNISSVTDTFPYQLLLKFSNTLPIEKAVIQRQFIIVRVSAIYSKGTTPVMNVVFTSPFTDIASC